jgi:hypothetical protein
VLPENLVGVMHLSVVGVKMRPDGHLRLAYRVQTRDGDQATIRHWICPSGAPEPAQLEDLIAFVAEELRQEILTRYGVQGSLAV